jgi:hypothetical protein
VVDTKAFIRGVESAFNLKLRYGFRFKLKDFQYQRSESMRFGLFVSVVAGSLLLSACIKEDVIKTAQEKKLVVEGQTLNVGGSYNETKKSLEISINGDPVMKSVFRNYNPTQNLNAEYKGLKVSSYCYFGSVLGSKGGLFGAVARGVQSAKAKMGDECEISVNGKPLEKLYF